MFHIRTIPTEKYDHVWTKHGFLDPTQRKVRIEQIENKGNADRLFSISRV